MEKEIKKLENHIIICGSGKFAQQVFKQLKAEEKDISILFISQDGRKIKDEVGLKTLQITDDPTNPKVLERAGIFKARAVVAAMEQEADNVFIILTAKNFNENIVVAARTHNEESEAVLRKAGASHIINPSVIGGKELATAILRPSGAAYIHELISSESTEFNVAEIKIDKDSAFLHKPLKQLKLYKKYNVFPAAISRNGELISNPNSNEQLAAHDILLIIGKREVIERIRHTI